MALRDYSYKYDAETKTFSSEPDHNWSSHAADAFMEGAARLELAAPPPEPSRIIVPPDGPHVQPRPTARDRGLGTAQETRL